MMPKTPVIAGAAADFPRLDYTPCLKALNEKSLMFKDRIVPLSKDGWSYVGGGETGNYKLESNPSKCSVKQEFGAGQIVAGLVKRATSKDNDRSNSAANKQEIATKCKDIVEASRPMRMGMMVPGGAAPDSGHQ